MTDLIVTYQHNFLFNIILWVITLRHQLPWHPSRQLYKRKLRKRCFCWRILMPIFTFDLSISALPIHITWNIMSHLFWKTLQIYTCKKPCWLFSFDTVLVMEYFKLQIQKFPRSDWTGRRLTITVALPLCLRYYADACCNHTCLTDLNRLRFQRPILLMSLRHYAITFHTITYIQ